MAQEKAMSIQLHKSEKKCAPKLKECAPKLKEGVKKVPKKLLTGTNTVAAAGEGLSISYGFTDMLFHDEKFQGPWGYAILAAGGLASLITEVLYHKGVIGVHKFHKFRIVEEAIAGAVVAAIFTQNFFPEDWQTVAIGMAITVALASIKSTLEILRTRKTHQSKFHIVSDYVLGSIFSGLMGAGIADYLFYICEGFGSPVDNRITLPITGALALGNVFAELPINKVSGEDTKHHLCYHPARTYRAGIFSGDISLFLVIFLFDIIDTATHSTDVKNSVFAIVITLAALQFLRTFVNKLVNDKKEEHELHEAPHAHVDEEKPLLEEHKKAIENKPLLESHEEKPLLVFHKEAEQKEKKKPCFPTEKISNYFHHFWRKSERELQDKSLKHIVIDHHQVDENKNLGSKH